ncbi:protein Jumonji-like [Lytechinus variegatus]|uniref:protein Jumonji-like n=1 Tax=Lytechinus variegatus TaxID=7654 RepID=UPI001BB1A7C2|nr:protein Jumonji-like [Lytechinus variegatus]
MSLERKHIHMKKVISGKFKFSMISSPKLVSTRTLKPELSKPVVTRSHSPKFMSPGLQGIKSKEVSKELSESIAHRVKASISGSSGSAMGNILCRPLRSQKKKQNAKANAVINDCADEKKNSGDFLPPPPPLPPPLLLTKKHKSNAVAHSKQSLTKCKERKCFAVSRESSAKASQVPSIHDKKPKLKSIPKQPLRSLRRDLRSRSKFKMPHAEPATSPATRRSTRGQNTSSSSPSSGASSYTHSQDETKSTTSSTSLVTRQSIARKAKERLMVKRKSSAAIVSSTSGEEDDVKSSKPKKAKVQAQRKFAYPQAYSPSYTPSKVKNGDMINSTKSCSIFNHCPSTEDFLTFLCLRGTPSLPPSLDLFKVQSKPIPNLLRLMPKQLAGRKRSAPSTLQSDSDINIPGIEPLPREDSAPFTPTQNPTKCTKTSLPRLSKTTAIASVTLMQQKMNIRDRRLRLDNRQFKASDRISKNLQNSLKSNKKNIVGNGPQQLPPNLSPVPPPILSIQRSRHPPPLIPIVPWENKRQTNNHLSSRNAAGRKSSFVRNNLTRSSGRSSIRNCVPWNNNTINHRLEQDLQEDQSPIITTSRAKNRGLRKEAQKNNHKNSDRQSRISQRLKNERCSGEVINGSNHLRGKLDPPNGHTLLSQIKLLKGSRRERKEKKCSCHSQNCSQITRSRHKNADREFAFEGAIEEVLKTAKRQKKLKDMKRRSSRKLRNSSVMLRDRVQAAELKLEDSIIEKADAINNVLSTNGISKRLTIPLTNCTFNNNVLRKESMICPKAHLNHEFKEKLTELKIKEGEEEECPVAKPNKMRNPLLLKNHKELLPSKVTSETTPQKLQKKAQGQSPKRNRAKTKNGLTPFKILKEEPPVESGPSRFIEGVKEGLVLRPTAEEWSDPMAYMESIADQLNEYGMCRVIPPDGWRVGYTPQEIAEQN